MRWKEPRPASGSGMSPPTTIEWSDNMGPLYGLPRGTQPAGVNDFLERIVHPEDREALGRLIEDAVRDGTAYEFDLRVSLPDRGERWLHTRARAVRGPDGRTSASPACSATSPSAATARRRTRSWTPRARCWPRRWTRSTRSRRSPSSPSRGSRTGARCSSRRRASSSPPSPTSTPRRSAGRASCRSAIRRIPTRRPARRT